MISPAQARDLQLLETLRSDPESERVLRLLSNLAEFSRRKDDPAQYTFNKLWLLLHPGVRRP